MFELIGFFLCLNVSMCAIISHEKLNFCSIFCEVQEFYKKSGFKIIDEGDVELEFVYFIEDYVMEKEL